MEKFLENIQEAQKAISIIDHMIYVTYPLVKDKRILIKLLTETKNVLTNCINAILQYEYFYKRINLSANPKTNFKIFQDKCAPRYQILKTEIDSILKLFELVSKHQQSTMEFQRNEHVVILSENLKTETVTLGCVKEFFSVSKSVLQKALAKMQ